MEQFPVTTLPDEIQASVAERVGANSGADLYRLGATCKSLKELTDRAGVYAALDVFTFPSHLQMSDGVIQVCYANGNPSILFLRAVQVFYTFELQDEGLGLIKTAADAGFERALYIYAMTQKVFCNNEEHLSGFTRESVERIDKSVRSLDWGCGRSHTDAFRTKKYEFMSKVILLFYNCKCTPLVERDWDLWHIEDSKVYEEVVDALPRVGNLETELSNVKDVVEELKCVIHEMNDVLVCQKRQVKKFKVISKTLLMLILSLSMAMVFVGKREEKNFTSL